MTALLEGPAAMGVILAVFTAIACLTLFAYIVGGIAHLLNFSVFGYRPLSGISSALESTVISGCNSAIRALDKTATYFENMLLDSLGILFALFALPFLGVRAALEYLWSHALKPLIHSITDHIEKDATQALAKAVTVERDLAHGIDRLQHEIGTSVAAGLHEAERFTHDTALGLERDFSRGIDTLSHDFERALRDATTGIEGDVSTALDKLRGAETQAIDSAEALAGATAHDLRELINRIPFTDIAALIASVPLLRAIVNVLEAETGLGNAECRSKIKGICATDPGEWENLLGLLVGGLALADFHEMAVISRSVFADLREGAREYARMR